MANSDFARFVKIGSKNGGNGRLVDVLLRSKRLPYAVTPELVWERDVTYRDFQTAGVRTQTITVTVGGTPDTEDYTISFLDGDVDAVYTGQPAESNDEIAIGLAAEITTLIATTLDGVVASASPSDDTVVIVFEPGIAVQELLLDAPAGATLTDVSAFDTVLDLDALVVGDGFPDDVCRGPLLVRVVEAFDTTVTTLAVGDVDSETALLSGADCTTLGYLESLVATQRSERFESSFAPLATLTTGEEDVSALGAGRLRIWLSYCPPPAIP